MVNTDYSALVYQKKKQPIQIKQTNIDLDQFLVGSKRNMPIKCKAPGGADGNKAKQGQAAKQATLSAEKQCLAPKRSTQEPVDYVAQFKEMVEENIRKQIILYDIQQAVFQSKGKPDPEARLKTELCEKPKKNSSQKTLGPQLSELTTIEALARVKNIYTHPLKIMKHLHAQDKKCAQIPQTIQDEIDRSQKGKQDIELTQITKASSGASVKGQSGTEPAKKYPQRYSDIICHNSGYKNSLERSERSTIDVTQDIPPPKSQAQCTDFRSQARLNPAPEHDSAPKTKIRIKKQVFELRHNSQKTLEVNCQGSIQQSVYPPNTQN